jgi:hypothetical protein
MKRLWLVGPSTMERKLFKDGRGIAILGALALSLPCALGAGAASASGAVPAATVTGALVAGAALSGEAGVIVEGAGPGVQIASATLTVDGVERDSSDDGALWLDTATLSDGTHSASITASDGAGDSGQVWSGFIQTANAPSGGSATIAGDPREGQTILAQSSGWSPQPASVTYQWERCDLAGDPCSPIAGATEAAYTVAAADDYGRLAVAVTASDTGGSTTITSNDSALVADLDGDTVASAIAAPLGSAFGQVVSPASSGGAPGAGTPPGATGADGGAAACRSPRLRASVGGRASAAVAFGRRVELRGSLHCGTAALKGAVLTVRLVPAEGSGRARRVTVRTGAGGGFHYAIAPGPSRRIRVSYAGADGGAAASVAANIVVTPRITLEITPTHTSNGHTITFSGAVSGGHQPSGGLPLELEYREGTSWMNYTLVLTDARSGRYLYRYTFRRTTQSITYTFRFAVPAGGVPGYPFAPAVSPARSVSVAP